MSEWQIMPARDLDWVAWKEGESVYVDRVAYFHMKGMVVSPVPYALADCSHVTAVFGSAYRNSFRLLRAANEEVAAKFVEAQPYPTECECGWEAVEWEDDGLPMVWELVHVPDCEIPKRDALEEELGRMTLEELQDTAEGCGAKPKDHKDFGYLIDAILAVEFPALARQ